MTITPQNLIALLPLLIVGLTVVVVMLSIAWRRNHFLNATLSVIGLNAALVSLWFVGQAGAMDVTPLMRVDGFAMLYTGLVLLASLATCTFAYPWLEGYNDNKDEFYLLVLIAALGGILLANANHLASLFLGIELISLPLFGWSVTLSARNVRWKPVSNTPFSLPQRLLSCCLVWRWCMRSLATCRLSRWVKTSATVCSTSRCCWQVSD